MSAKLDSARGIRDNEGMTTTTSYRITQTLDIDGNSVRRVVGNRSSYADALELARLYRSLGDEWAVVECVYGNGKTLG